MKSIRSSDHPAQLADPQEIETVHCKAAAVEIALRRELAPAIRFKPL
jgi:hypothetical protein